MEQNNSAMRHREDDLRMMIDNHPVGPLRPWRRDIQRSRIYVILRKRYFADVLGRTDRATFVLSADLCTAKYQRAGYLANPEFANSEEGIRIPGLTNQDFERIQAHCPDLQGYLHVTALQLRTEIIPRFWLHRLRMGGQQDQLGLPPHLAHLHYLYKRDECEVIPRNRQDAFLPIELHRVQLPGMRKPMCHIKLLPGHVRS